MLRVRIRNHFRESSMRNHRKNDVAKIINECAWMRCIQPELVHRTIHEFNYFVESLIFHKERIFNDLKDVNVSESVPFFEKVNHFAYEGKRTIIMEARLFHEYCSLIYNKPDDYYF